MKKFIKWGLIIAAFWLLSDFLIYMAINGTYQHIDVQVLTKEVQVNVADSKATYVNGYVKGNIYNSGKNTIQKKYLKIDCYSPRDMLMGTKYVAIENLEPGKTMELNMWFKYTDVEYCKITTTDKVENATEEQFISEETQYYIILGLLAWMIFA